MYALQYDDITDCSFQLFYFSIDAEIYIYGADSNGDREIKLRTRIKITCFRLLNNSVQN